MKKISYHFLRLSLGVTFLWIGVLILQAPEEWATFIQPWAAKLLLISPVQVMVSTGILDVVVGLFLIFGIWTWLAAWIAALHLVAVLVASGFNAVTVRDVGLLGAAVALALEYTPADIVSRLAFWRKI